MCSVKESFAEQRARPLQLFANLNDGHCGSEGETRHTHRESAADLSYTFRAREVAPLAVSREVDQDAPYRVRARFDVDFSVDYIAHTVTPFSSRTPSAW